MNKRMINLGIIGLLTLIIISVTSSGSFENFKVGIIFLIMSLIFTIGILILVLEVKSQHKIYDRIAGFETTLNEKMMILLGIMLMVTITSGGFLYNFKIGMVFLITSLIFSFLVLKGVISLKPRVGIFKMTARIENLGKKKTIRIFGIIFSCIFIVFTISETWAYFTLSDDKGNEVAVTTNINKLVIKYGENTGLLKPGEITTSLSSPQKVDSKISISVAEPIEGVAPYSYSITINDSLVSNSNYAEWTPNIEGTYKITAITEDSNGNVGRKSIYYIIEKEAVTSLTIHLDSDYLATSENKEYSNWWNYIHYWSDAGVPNPWPGKSLGKFGVRNIVIENFNNANRKFILVNGNKIEEKTKDIEVKDGATEIWIDVQANVRYTQEK